MYVVARLSSRSRLEETIQRRTAELRHANNTMQQEIRERRAAEAALRKSDERLNLALQSTGFGIWD